MTKTKPSLEHLVWVLLEVLENNIEIGLHEAEKVRGDLDVTLKALRRLKKRILPLIPGPLNKAPALSFNRRKR